MRSVIAKILCVFSVLFALPAFAQTDFSTWDKYSLENPNGQERLSPSGGPLIRMQNYSKAGLEAAAQAPLDKFGAGLRDQIDYALSILSLSMTWDERFDGNTLSGLVQAADGVYSFKASMSADGRELTVALVATDDTGAVLTGPAAEARRIAGAATSATVAKIGSGHSAQRTARTAQTQQSRATPPTRQMKSYTPPQTIAEMDRWPSIGKLTRSVNPSDPLAPRYYLAQTGPKYGVRDFATATQKLPSVSPLELRGQPTVEPLDAWAQYDGSRAGIVMQQTRLSGEPGVIVLFMTQKKGKSDIIYLGYEVTEKTFKEWGGITRMMKLRRVIPSIDAFPKATRDRISQAAFKQQTQLYEAALDKVLKNGVASMYAMSQAQTVMRMQELNYDLLLGGDITSPMISD
ncbi:hypothetical protein [Fretibacter rubidus]|uniref:hypothetical protein n=1 Tax=Fretibacter rubidus TaxID=570162 RepID=UPI00352AB336